MIRSGVMPCTAAPGLRAGACERKRHGFAAGVPGTRLGKREISTRSPCSAAQTSAYWGVSLPREMAIASSSVVFGLRPCASPTR